MAERLFVRLEEDAAQGPESGAPEGTLAGLPVAAPLRPFVAHVLHYAEALAPGAEIVERVVPDGALRLVFNLGDAPGEGASLARPALVLGPSARPALVRLRGRMEGLSVTLRPGAARLLLGVPAGVLEDEAVELDTWWSGDGTRLVERLHEAPDVRARLALVEAALLRRLPAAVDGAAVRAAEAARLLAARGGGIAVRRLAEVVGVGERRLQALFREDVGLSPRTFGRLARLHACLRLLRRAPARRWAEAAVDAGYYDQAHLANEVRALCGLTPTELLARSGSSKTARGA